MDDHAGVEQPLLGNNHHRFGAREHDDAYARRVATAAPSVEPEDAEDAASTDTTSSPFDSETQTGVQLADAVNLVWTKHALVLVYCFIFLNFFINSLEAQTSSNLIPYVVSNFSAHALIPAVSITSQILGGVLKLPIAKLIDTWGRPQGLLVATVFGTVGLIMLSWCRDVKTYAAAQIFHTIGFNGVQYILDIIIADTSSLQDRALAFAFANSPFILTTFVGPVAAKWFLRHSSWRVSFALFAVLTPLVAAPVFIILQANARKAKDLGVVHYKRPERTWQKSIHHYLVEFDAMGIVLAASGLTLFLLPFSIAGSAGSKWSSPLILGMLLLGCVLIGAFVLFEHYCAPKPFVPFQLLLSRNVMGAFVLSAVFFISYYCWDGYYTSYLQVVHQLSVAEAGYVASIFTIGTCLSGLVVGWLVRRTDRFKSLALAAVPVHALGGGLMIFFRQPHTPVLYVILCQVLISAGGGVLVITHQMAAMAVAKHGEVASLLALLGLSSAVGAAIGSSVSGAIWTNTVYVELVQRLPDDAKHLAKLIYEDLERQLSYPVGDPVREALMQAYGIAQRRMVIAGLAMSLIALPSVMVWKDIRVSQIKQVKGRVL
ncbi:major facilitator superfamily domain-containing protein [Coniella lustricola]|uniref:Major facilitator superfamily domain-containing protein n=1 Tax=Coniella lustricola TaxID=2025994 RepID=A0A2T2ZSR8_9PEZI|nr:major facilitator superfamily domain-containing protein [Coniella lustricola]